MVSCPKNLNTGFVLIYVVIISVIMATMVGIMVHSALTETSVSRDAGETVKAFFAADSGIECARFLQASYQAFDSTSPTDTYDCGLGPAFDAGSGDPTCQERTYTFILDEFSNGTCAKIEARSVPMVVFIEGNPVTICTIQVFSEGKNSCDDPTVEITRWENM